MTISIDASFYFAMHQPASDEAATPQRVEPITLLPADDDQTLVAACLRGEEVAWQTLLERYGRLIYTIALRFGFSQLAAEEVYQDVSLIVFEKLATLRDPHRLAGWLASVTRRTCLARLRLHESVITLDDAVESMMVEHGAVNRFEEKVLLVEQHEMLRQAMAELEPRCQQLLQALFFAPLPESYETIAAQLAIPLGSVSPLRHRCLEKLRFKLLHIDPTLGEWKEPQAKEAP